MWWFVAVIPALEKLRQEDLQFQASLGYIQSSRPIPGYTERPCLRKQTNKKCKTKQILLPNRPG
jgi:hypothetical protein